MALLLPVPLGPGTISRQGRPLGKPGLQSHSLDETRKGKKRAESQGEKGQLRSTNGWESWETGLRDDSASGGKGCLEMALAVPAPWGSWGSTCLEAIYPAVSVFSHRLWMHPSIGTLAVHRVLFPSPGYCWISGFFFLCWSGSNCSCFSHGDLKTGRRFGHFHTSSQALNQSDLLGAFFVILLFFPLWTSPCNSSCISWVTLIWSRVIL